MSGREKAKANFLTINRSFGTNVKWYVQDPMARKGPLMLPRNPVPSDSGPQMEGSIGLGVPTTSLGRADKAHYGVETTAQDTNTSSATEQPVMRHRIRGTRP